MKRFFFIVAIFLWGWLTWHLTTTPNLVIAPESLFNTILMMGGHFFFFGIFAVLLRLNALNNTSSAMLSSLYGLFIEYVQLTVPGRSADPLDWLLDTLGALVFLGILNKYKLIKIDLI